MIDRATNSHYTRDSEPVVGWRNRSLHRYEPPGAAQPVPSCGRQDASQ